MSVPQFAYTDGEWDEAAGHHPISGLDATQLLLLHRHWIWANRERALFDAELQAGGRPNPDTLAEDAVAAMFLWYGLLWSVIEAFEERGLELRARFAEDISSLADPLRRCRNAVFHVSRDSYYDRRLFEVMADPEAAAKLRRISSGFGRLFLEEYAARGTEPATS